MPRFARRNHGKSHSYTLDGAWIPGVTTVIGLLDKPALVEWAAKETAAYADEHWSELSSLRSADRIDRLVKARYATNRRAIVKGNRVHNLGEKVAHHEAVEVPAELRSQVEAYARFLDRWSFATVATETPCCNTEYGYAGTFDLIVDSPRLGRSLMDIKGLALDTPIPTPTGWTTMGEVQVGDHVIAANGSPCTVTIKSPTKRIGTYAVRFDDGSEIVCDSEHIWWTQGRKESAPTAKPVADVIASLTHWGQKSHRVPVAGALDLPDIELPIEPYLLGCWLGDGKVQGGEITKGPDLFEVLEADGHQLGVEQACHSDQCVTRTVLGLRTRLIETGLRGAKRIPAEYLRAGRLQRLRLLQGLMDTDGTWNTARNRAMFTSTDAALAEQVFELLATLGQRPHIAAVQRTGFGVTTTAYDVEWTPVGIAPFRLPRKAAKVTPKMRPYHATRRVIVSIEPGPDVETACIGVDSANHTYLCGRAMIPTHNTGKGVYSEVGLQLNAYASADLRLEGVEKIGPRGGKTVEWVERPMPKVDSLLVAHVLDDEVELVPVKLDPAITDSFLYLLEVFQSWHRRTSWDYRDDDAFDPPVGRPIWPEDVAASEGVPF